MPKLSVPTIGKYKPTKDRREIPDAGAPGTWLRLVIQPSGARSFAMRFRRPSGRPAKLTLGPFVEKETGEEPVLGAALTLSQARELAIRLHRQRKLGNDIVEKHKAAKSRRDTDSQDRAANTFGKAVVEFVRDHKTKWGMRPRRWRGDATLLGLRWPKDADPAETEPTVVRGSLADTWGDRPLANIDSHNVFTVIEDARNKGVPGMKARNKHKSDARGRKAHAAISVFFRWALQKRKVASNPTQGVWHPGAPPSRDRVLSDVEIKAFWLAGDAIAEPFRTALRVLLLTGCRVNEVVGMRRSELAEDGTWTIPIARTKNHRAHVLPLPPLAQEMIEGLPQIEGGFVFTTTGKTPISGWSKTKRALDKVMGPKVAPWRLHDLRRTAASGMQRLGVRAEVVERALNHISGVYRGVSGTYQRDTLSEEVRAALAHWSQHVSGLVAGKSGKPLVLHR